MSWRRAALWVLASWALAAPLTAAPSAEFVLPLLVQLAYEEGRPVAEQEFLDEQLARANQIFAPYGVAFRMELISAPVRARMGDRMDRDSLAPHVRHSVINCFVVAGLMDVDEPGRVRRGVHWHAPGGQHYVILSAISEPDVLAHELGHFLGNPRHSATPGNLMSYERGPELPFLDAAQVRRVRHAIRRYVRSGELQLGSPP